MDQALSVMVDVIKTSGMIAPALFILLHVFRQMMFIPVVAVCMAGGILFGSVYGTLYSLIGISLTSFLFYFVVQKLPKMKVKLVGMKQKWVGRHRNLSIGQIAILRLIPFVHFHLLSFCLIEASGNFKEYMKSSVYTNAPVAVLYTYFGHSLDKLTPFASVVILILLGILFYLFRQKQLIIKWNDFFSRTAS